MFSIVWSFRYMSLFWYWSCSSLLVCFVLVSLASRCFCFSSCFASCWNVYFGFSVFLFQKTLWKTREENKPLILKHVLGLSFGCYLSFVDIVLNFSWLVSCCCVVIINNVEVVVVVCLFGMPICKKRANEITIIIKRRIRKWKQTQKTRIIKRNKWKEKARKMTKYYYYYWWWWWW